MIGDTQSEIIFSIES
uniref:Uncharacterized protein n=1 Tax=Lepeophtheirus salmonis TaxID=72036 RepID=A0A0K2VJX3_LEPSM